MAESLINSQLKRVVFAQSISSEITSVAKARIERIERPPGIERCRTRNGLISVVCVVQMPAKVSDGCCLDHHLPRRNLVLHRHVELLGIRRAESVVHGKHGPERIVGEIIINRRERRKSVADALAYIDVTRRNAQGRSERQLPEQPHASSFAAGGVVEQAESAADNGMRQQL